jgi:hypothetical protein
MGSSRCVLGLLTLAVIVIVAAETRAEEAMGWVFGRKMMDLTPLGLSLLNAKGDSGFQLALIQWGATQRFSVGLGYDDMVTSAQRGGEQQHVPITEQLFLLQTPCDKRFQFTVRFRW